MVTMSCINGLRLDEKDCDGRVKTWIRTTGSTHSGIPQPREARHPPLGTSLRPSLTIVRKILGGWGSREG